MSDIAGVIKDRRDRLSEACGCEVIDMEHIADAKFPESLSKLPYVEDGTYTSSVRFVSTYIESDTPTDDEINVHVKSISDNYGPDMRGWLLKLGCIVLPGFEGEEPTVEEFFSVDFDSSRVKPKHLLVSYPVIK